MAEIVNFNLNELPLEGIDLTDDEKSRIVLTLQGRALKNPVKDSLVILKTEVDRLVPIFNQAWQDVLALENLGTYTSSTANEYYPITSDVLKSIYEGLVDYSASLASYKSHTDILSGVNLKYAGFPPNFLGRLGMAQAYNQYKETLRKKTDEGCDIDEAKKEIFSKIFKSILGHGENEMVSGMNKIQNADITLQYDTSGIDNVTFANALVTDIATGISNITSLKNSDDSGYYEAYNFVVAVSLGQGLISAKNEPFAEYLLEKVNGTILLNKDDISNLKIRCQDFPIDTLPPGNNFSTDFSNSLSLANIYELVDVSTAGATVGDLFQFTSNNLWENVSLASVGLSLNDLSNVSGADVAPPDSYVLAYNSSTGYYEPAAQSGGGSGGGTTFVSLSDTPGSITSNQFVKANAAGNALIFSGITDGDIAGLAMVATTADYSDLINTPTNVSAFTNDSGYVTSAIIDGLSTVGHTHSASDIVSGTFTDARISESSVTQHQAALSITESQISDLNHTVSALSSVGDVTITTITSGEILKWNGSAWVNQTLAEAGVSATGHTHDASDITTGTLGLLRGGTGSTTLPFVTNYTAGSATVSGHLSGIDSALGLRLEDITAESIGSLSDVTIGAATNLDVLAHNGSNWGDVALTTSHIQSGTFADARISESSVTQHQAALSILHSQLAGGSEISGTTFPTTNLYTGRQYYNTTYNEMFTYHDGTGLPSSTPVWLGELQTLTFGTTNTTRTSGTQSMHNSSNVLGVKDSRGYLFKDFDIMTMGYTATNGDSTAISGTFDVWQASTSVFSHTWTSQVTNSLITFQRITAGNIVMATFTVTGGTMKRMLATMKYRHVITA